LSVVQKCSGCKALTKAANELIGESLFGRSDGRRIPFCTLHIIDGDKGGFATHGESDVAGGESSVNFAAEAVDAFPVGV